jgi:hypothetical protein
VSEEPRGRGYFETRWRQLRNPPPPVLRAVLANLAVALIGGLLLYGAALFSPGIDLAPWIVLFVVVVVVAGSVLTYLWVELPTGAGNQRRRSAWAGVLGLFAALPIAYLVLVVFFQLLPTASSR